MKVLSTEGLTKLIQLIKSSFISTSNTVTTNTVTLADVATSGDYDDLINKPTIPAAQVNSDWNATSGVAQILNKPTLATVATSGSYNDLSNKPTIPSEVTESIVSGWGFTKNTGTVMSVNNIEPTNGNVAISIPDTSTLANQDLSNLSTTGQNIADTTLDQNTSTRLKYWSGTKAQYDAIATKDDNTIYNVDDSSTLVVDILNSLYPIGAIYIGTMATCPLSVLGVGTWQLVAQDRVLQGAGTRGTVGTTINESLPNIKGTLMQDGIADSGTTNGVVWGSSGVFGTITSSGTWRAQYPPSASGAVKDTIPFNASNSSSTYQDNAPVQQDAYLVNIWERTA